MVGPVQHLIFNPPSGKGAIASVTCGVCMRACLNAPPVVTGCDRHGIDAIHGALVVRGGSVGVRSGKCPCFHDALGDDGSRERFLIEQVKR